MPEFKTSFVAEPVDYGAYGLQLDEVRRKRAAEEAAAKKKQREEVAKAYDLDKAMQTDVPNVIDRYRPALQATYDEWFDASQKAQLDPSSENLARVNAARTQYMQFKDTAVSASTVFSNNIADLRKGTLDDKLVFSRQETLEDAKEWNNPLEFEMVDGALMMNGATGQAYWNQTEYFDPERGLNFIPAVKARETEYMIAPFAETQAKRLDHKLSTAIKDNTGRNKGVNTNMVADGVWDAIMNETIKGTDVPHAVAIEFQSYEQGVERVGGEDVETAYTLYDPSNIMRSPYGAKGAVTWDPEARRYNMSWKMSDEEIINEVGDNDISHNIIQQRRAMKHYYESTATLTMEQIMEKYQLDAQGRSGGGGPDDAVDMLAGTPIAWGKDRKGAVSFSVGGSKQAFNIRIGDMDERVTNVSFTPDGIIRTVSFNTENLIKKQLSSLRADRKDALESLERAASGAEDEALRAKIQKIDEEIEKTKALNQEITLYEGDKREDVAKKYGIDNPMLNFEYITQSLYNTDPERFNALQIRTREILGLSTGENSVPSSEPAGGGFDPNNF